MIGPVLGLCGLLIFIFGYWMGYTNGKTRD